MSPLSSRSKLNWLIVLSLLTGNLGFIGCAPSFAPDIDQRIGSITDPYEFSIPEWELNTLLHELWESLKPATVTRTEDVETVREYFELIEKGTTPSQDLENTVERILTRQITRTLFEEGIINPLDTYLPLNIVFPPLNFEFQSPPHLLIISPRDEIRLLRRTTLEPGLTTSERETIESRVDSQDISSLVVGLGGVGFTYPTMVVESSNIRRTIERITEEWFHQYLVFQPMGLLYALDAVGWRSDYDIIVMNETFAGIVSKEIGARVYQKYYALEGESTTSENSVSEFYSLMREIRIRVDEYLAQGKVDEAEEFMQESRDFLASKGYHIRKLNQAYFAFYGTYADKPDVPSSIGQDLQKLRQQSSSLKEFTDRVKGMKSPSDLSKAVEGIEE